MRFQCMAILVFFILSFYAVQAQASCGSALCPLNTQLGLQNYNQTQKTQIDLHFEWIDQEQPRAGTQDVAVGEISKHHDEVRTINRNTLLSIDHAFNDQMGISVSMPWRDLTHDHIHNHNQGTEHIPEHWDFSGIGDTRVLAHYKTLAGLGFVGGLKLPTGSFTQKNDEDELAERSLQLGTGTTDLVTGIFYQHHDIAKPYQWFVQGLFQSALNERDQYKPGNTFKLDAGMQYQLSERWSGLTQINAIFRGKDSGDEAEPEDTGSHSVYFSPGLRFSMTPSTSLYGVLQQPIYRDVNGVQLTENYSLAVGVRSYF